MASIIFYILFFTVWIYALNRSVAYSGIDAKINAQVSIHWLQVLFWIAVGTILSGSTLILLTDHLMYLNVVVFGTIFGWSTIVWIFFHTEWDERAMIYHKHQYMYLQLPRAAKSVLALEHFVSSKLDHAQLFAGSLESANYTVETEWPPTAHGGRHDEASRKEFDKYPRGAMNFFLRMTQKKDA